MHGLCVHTLLSSSEASKSGYGIPGHSRIVAAQKFSARSCRYCHLEQQRLHWGECASIRVTKPRVCVCVRVCVRAVSALGKHR